MNVLLFFLVALPVFSNSKQLLTLNKPAVQSSTLGSFGANRAVDGKLTWPDCAHSGNKGDVNTWSVDLQQKHDIKSIKIFNREGLLGRLRDLIVSLSVDGTTFTECARFKGPAGSITVWLECQGSGRHVKIEQTTKNHLTLCEVQVYDSALEDETVSHKGDTYVISEKVFTLAEAHQKCRDAGAELFFPRDEQEHDIISDLAKTRFLSIWLNINDIVEEGKWVNGRQTTQTVLKWAEGEPNNRGGKEHCAFQDKNGIHDVNCWTSLEKQTICRKLKSSEVSYTADENKLGESVFSFHSEKLSGTETSKVCQKETSQLYYAKTKEEYDAIRKIASRRQFGVFWTGLSDASQEGMYLTSNNDLKYYSYWEKGEPNNYANNQDCVAVGNHGLTDLECPRTYPFVCRKVKTDQVNPPVDPQIKSGIYTENGSKYKFHADKVSLHAAMKTCREEKSELYFPKSQEEHLFINDLARRRGLSEMWLNINDIVKEGKWMNGRGTTQTILKWRNGEPNNANSREHCAVQRTDGFYDISCTTSKKLQFICRELKSGEVSYIDENKIGDTVFSFHMEKLSGTEAAKACREKDSQLFYPKTKEEYDEIRNLATRRQIGNFWAGLSDSFREGMYITSNNDLKYYSLWAPGEPNNYGNVQDCVAIESRGFTDLNCVTKYPYVCRKVPKAQIDPARDPSIESGIYTEDGSKYKFHTDKLSLLAAKIACQKENSELYFPRTQVEHLFINDLAKRRGASDMWLNIDDIVKEGKWMNGRGTTQTILKWRKGEPNNGNNREHCAAQRTDGFYDIQCTTSSKLQFICRELKSGEVSYIDENKVGETVFSFHMESVSGTEAAKACREKNSQLFYPKTKEEYDKIRNLATRRQIGNFWAGLSDSVQEGMYITSNNDLNYYSLWAPGEPNNYANAQDCVAIESRGFTDLECQRTYPYVCRKVPNDQINPAADPSIESGEYTFNDHKLIFVKTPMRRTDAMRDCRSKGAELYFAINKAEHDFVTDLATRRGALSRSRNMWININDIESEGVWRNGQGNTRVYLPWASNEPNNNKDVEHCAYQSVNGFNDVQCTTSSTFQFVCRELKTGEVSYINQNKIGAELYSFHNKRVTKQEASSVCKGEQSELFYPLTESEYNSAQQLAKRYILGNFWIGLDDTEVEGVFATERGNLEYLLKWKPGEPNNYGGKEDCAIDTEAGFANVPCQNKYTFICRKLPTGSVFTKDPRLQSGVYERNGLKHEFMREPLTFYDAIVKCGESNREMYYPKTSEDHKYFKDLAYRRSFGTMWVNINRNQNNDLYVTSEPRKVTFFDWSTKREDKRDCVELRSDGMLDSWCGWKHKFICVETNYLGTQLLSINKPAVQSSTYGSYGANKAVDGKLTWPDCAHSGNKGDVNTWSVDLLKQYDIKSIKIYNREGLLSRTRDLIISLSVDGKIFTECAQFKGPAKHMTSLIKCEGSASHVKIEQTSKNHLTLCEVEIFGDSKGEITNVAPEKRLIQSSGGTNLRIFKNYATYISNAVMRTKEDSAVHYLVLDLGEPHEVSYLEIANTFYEKQNGTLSFFVTNSFDECGSRAFLVNMRKCQSSFKMNSVKAIVPCYGVGRYVGILKGDLTDEAFNDAAKQTEILIISELKVFGKPTGKKVKTWVEELEPDRPVPAISSFFTFNEALLSGLKHLKFPKYVQSAVAYRKECQQLKWNIGKACEFENGRLLTFGSYSFVENGVFIIAENSDKPEVLKKNFLGWLKPKASQSDKLIITEDVLEYEVGSAVVYRTSKKYQTFIQRNLINDMKFGKISIIFINDKKTTNHLFHSELGLNVGNHLTWNTEKTFDFTKSDLTFKDLPQEAKLDFYAKSHSFIINNNDTSFNIDHSHVGKYGCSSAASLRTIEKKYRKFAFDNYACAKRPVGGIEKQLIMDLYGSVIKNQVFKGLKAPGVDLHPGDYVTSSPERINDVTVKIDSGREIHATGLYLLPGDTLRYIVHTEDLHWAIRIGCHTDTIPYKFERTWKRFRNIHSVTGRLQQHSGEFYSPYGGVIWLQNSDNVKQKIIISFSNVIRSPLLNIRDQNSINKWSENRLRPGFWTEMAGDAIIHCLDSRRLRNFSTEKMLAAMESYDKVVKSDHNIKGENWREKRRFRMSVDTDISVGWGHSGYPYMGFLPWFNGVFNVPSWGHCHEIGHNMQRGQWTDKDSGEVTNNVLCLYNYETTWNTTIFPRGKEGSESDIVKLKKYFEDDNAAKVYDRLRHWGQIAHHLGWGAFQKTFSAYLRDKLNPKTDMEKRTTWVNTLSKEAGLNMMPLYDLWKIPYELAKIDESVKKLPCFMPDDYITKASPDSVAKVLKKYDGKCLRSAPKKLEVKILEPFKPYMPNDVVEMKLTTV